MMFFLTPNRAPPPFIHQFLASILKEKRKYMKNILKIIQKQQKIYVFLLNFALKSRIQLYQIKGV